MKNPLFLGADPFILYWEGKYYMYPTIQVPDAPLNSLLDPATDGYQVYVSDDLENWECKGYCLRAEDVKGDKCFWAPEILVRDGKFYMVYTAEEHIGVAVADNPLGPFTQQEKRWLSEERAIDGHFFLDDDGQVYIYYVRLRGGNKIYVTTMAEDMLSMDEASEKELLVGGGQEWETYDCRVAEGPFIIKHNDLYYMTYSSNHTRSPYYAIGCAIAASPWGPFERYEGNPILSKTETVVGVGHHSFAKIGDNKWVCAYHSHFSPDQFKPRRTRIDLAEFVKDPNGGADILVIHGPTEE